MACAENISSTKLLSENDQVILKKGKCCQVFQIKKKRFVWLDKVKFTLDGVIGHRYGTTFRVTNGEMVKVNKKELDEAFQSTEQGKDNRGLHDLDSNQKLSRDDIELMKKTGMEGEKIIDQLIENSTTFKDKTEYAQEKWIKKKKKKHLQIFTVLKPTARLLCEMYHGKAPQKICHIRIDTLAQILTYSNVRANCNMAVVDTTNGLVDMGNHEKGRRLERRFSVACLFSDSFALIVACKYHPTPIVLALLDYIAPCRPIVLYSQHKEPLMDCYAFMRERGGIVNFRLTETWLREYQVLPMRTHPHIGMSGGGGYLLTALTLMKPT
ncbi:tRNA (adenine-N(1)-)-methyltransferase non-catalytic subunit [Mytilus galloprovincialis]|uniref:tRNA (adenine(58)-N(1))-methyltransferase non-catalytic subunit TRM6 n=1 Tax=Mytilus galloprovincialis TaxID=29158 RepID=A0A8B6EJJ6_MYTGA|nr:tRNA (adenine-N(1)-)-methyltransferase non-catalytic subunit [Mytilus galloprovincialis]